MSAIINTNLNGLQAQASLMRSSNSLASAMQRLSSGLRINSAADDAAGLAISSRMTTQITGASQAARNANDGISLTQTADTALANIGDNLQRLRQLAVQAANGSNSASDRAALQQEAAQLVAETDRIASQTQFNGMNLLDGSFAGQQFQLGANAGQTVAVSALPSARSDTLGRYHGISGNLSNVNPTYGSTDFHVDLISGASYDFGNVNDDAKAMADAINSGQMAGLTAVARANTVAAAAAQTSTGSASGTGVLTLNGVAINLAYVSGGNANIQNRTNTVTAINAQTSNTGVIASDNGVGVVLTAADGRNIITAYASGTATASVLSDFGLGAAGSFGSSVDFTYREPVPLASNQIYFQGGGMSNGATLGWSYTFSGNIHNGTALANISLATIAGASTALQSLDDALATVNSTRAAMGAAGNRLAAALNNLQNSGQSLSAARSRVQDADFAQETTTLARAQILQNAGTAMVAQANQQPQNVLVLLR